MKRRQVITGLAGLTSAAMVSQWPLKSLESDRITQALDLDLPLSRWPLNDGFDGVDPLHDRERPVLAIAVNTMDDRDSQTMHESDKTAKINVQNVPQAQLVASEEQLSSKQQRAINKSIDFAKDYDDDVFVTETEMPLLHSVFLRLQNLQKTIGYGHFNVVSFDEALTYSKRFNQVGEFSPAETVFIEKLFTTNASEYGFYGEKVLDQLTQSFKKSETVKVPYTGHYLFNNDSLAYYKKLRKEVGDSIILTSGIRSNVKQLYLFVAKTVRVQGNLSRASRSLAPPGYSFHGIGDFDVGRAGWGAKNFTNDFSTTEEFKRMRDLGYVAIRYDQGNNLGVRFEPWHIKVV